MKAYQISLDEEHKSFDVAVGDSKWDAVKLWMDSQIKLANFSGYSEDKWIRRQGYEGYQHMLGELVRMAREFPGLVFGARTGSKRRGTTAGTGGAGSLAEERR